MADLNVTVSDSDSLSESISLKFPLFDEHKNFAYSTVVTAPSPATSGTTLTVAAGQGVLFPTPPFNATVWQVGTQPMTTNSEIVRVISTNGSNGVNGDIFTLAPRVTRTEVVNQSRAIIVSDQIAATITAKTMTDVEVSGGANSAFVATSESTASTSFTDLATVGPSVTVMIGANGLALVVLYAAFSSATATVNCYMGFAISGANTAAAVDNYSDEVRQTDANAAGLERQGADFLLTGLNPGFTTFTAKYRTNANTAIFAERRIAVIPF